MGSSASVESVQPGLATAAAAVLEDAITCCICFNVYRDPHALPCLHTLCKPCIDKLAVGGKVECPECRESSDKKNIRKDFKTQSLIDAHLKIGGGAGGGSKTDERSLMSKGYLNLIPNKYQLSGAQDCDSYIHKIYIIQNQIWCTSYYHGIQIYDKNMQFIKRIKHGKYSYVTGLTECHGVILACCDTGVHHIKPNGSYVRKTSNKDFSDITSNGRYVYGLQWAEPSKIVIIFTDESYNWTEIGEIPINKTCDSSDELIANTNSLFLSLYGNSCIQKYSLEGKLQQTFGSDGTGALSGPILCSVDVDQNLLVADINNKQLKVYNSEKKEWHVVPLELYLSPRYAVTDEKNIWVLTDQSKILKFTQI